MVFFDKVPLAPPDPILGLTVAFQKEARKEKVNLGVGVYNNEKLEVPILESVKQAEEFLLGEERSKEYLPICGDLLYLDQLGGIVFGERFWSKEKKRIASFQTVGGTGALKIGGTFLKEELNASVAISSPTWPNHRGVFSHCELKVEEYPYYNKKSRGLDVDKLIAYLDKLSLGSVIVLHGACHNPTGCDPSLSEWKVLLELFQQKQLVPFFDFAYQGLGSGLEQDAEAIRLFAASGLEMFVAVSNAKNLSLYGERLGSLFIVSQSAKVSKNVSSRVKQMIRVNYSNPPMHGAKVAAHIFSTPALRKMWENELKIMRERIQSMRELLVHSLSSKIKTIDFSPLAKGNGMFGYLGLDKAQVSRLTAEYGIYMPSDGRINVCGLSHNNLEYVVNAIAAVISEK